MAVRSQARKVDQSHVLKGITARSLLLVSSGMVRKCEKEPFMTKIRKQITKWVLPATKISLAVSLAIAYLIECL